MILAQTQAADRFEYHWAWLDQLSEAPGLSAAVAGGLLAVLALTWLGHRRERGALSAPLWWALLAMRFVAIVGVVIFLLGPQRRRAEEVTRPSRVVVLVDSSVSMAMPNELNDGTAPRATRHEAAAKFLAESGVLEQLAASHVVMVAATGDAGRPVAFNEAPAAAEEPDESEEPTSSEPIDWSERLQPTVAQTRLGDALRQTLDQHAGQPLAGIVLVSDGQNNAGEDPGAVAADAAGRDARVLTIGLGPDRAGTNVIVRELIAPAKVYPSDTLEITAVVDATGDPTGQPALSLFRRPENAAEDAEVLLATQPVEWGENEEPASVRFETEPPPPGRYRYRVRATPLPRETRRDDNERHAVVEVVDRVTRVLLWASGPNRDFRFLRNQLRRDESFVVDVLLATAGVGTVQDADSVLDHFPETAEELEPYDVVVAFDPDWTQLTQAQAELVEQWVSDAGGGLCFVPGPVNTPRWLQRRPSQTILNLLPVTLPERLTLLDGPPGAATPTQPSAVRLTRAGRDAEFLWIAGGRDASAAAWDEFDGFYRLGRTASIQPGATVFAEAGEGVRGDARVLFAEQFYGAGRVFYLGTTEVWRLRKEDPNYFSTLQTKLLRRLWQGRLLAKSPGGSLLFERERYDLGDTLVLRAIVPDSRRFDALRAQVSDSAGETIGLALQPSESQPGMWVGRLPAQRDGVYEALASVGASDDLLAYTEVVVPQAERDRPTRNEADLTRIARAGSGWYYPTFEAAIQGAGAAPALADALPSRTETRTVFGRPDRQFAEQVSRGLLALICGSLLIEWLVRRLTSLA